MLVILNVTVLELYLELLRYVGYHAIVCISMYIIYISWVYIGHWNYERCWTFSGVLQPRSGEGLICSSTWFSWWNLGCYSTLAVRTVHHVYRAYISYYTHMCTVCFSFRIWQICISAHLRSYWLTCMVFGLFASGPLHGISLTPSWCLLACSNLGASFPWTSKYPPDIGWFSFANEKICPPFPNKHKWIVVLQVAFFFPQCRRFWRSLSRMFSKCRCRDL